MPPKKRAVAAPISDHHFAQVVQHAADNAPEEHGFGPHKVFIHHVYEAAKPQLGTMSLEHFKQRLPHQHRTGLLTMERADMVAAMDPRKVSASETHDDGATHHFLRRTSKSLSKGSRIESPFTVVSINDFHASLRKSEADHSQLLGHTKSGKAVHAPSADHVRATVTKHALTTKGHLKAGSDAETHAHNMKHPDYAVWHAHQSAYEAKHANFTHEDHKDAARLHRQTAQNHWSEAHHLLRTLRSGVGRRRGRPGTAVGHLATLLGAHAAHGASSEAQQSAAAPRRSKKAAVAAAVAETGHAEHTAAVLRHIAGTHDDIASWHSHQAKLTAPKAKAPAAAAAPHAPAPAAPHASAPAAAPHVSAPAQAHASTPPSVHEHPESADLAAWHATPPGKPAPPPPPKPSGASWGAGHIGQQLAHTIHVPGAHELMHTPRSANVHVHMGKSLGTLDDLVKKMELMPRPVGPVPPPRVYLPGVHGKDVKDRAAKMRTKKNRVIKSGEHSMKKAISFSRSPHNPRLSTAESSHGVYSIHQSPKTGMHEVSFHQHPQDPKRYANPQTYPPNKFAEHVSRHDALVSANGHNSMMNRIHRPDYHAHGPGESHYDVPAGDSHKALNRVGDTSHAEMEVGRSWGPGGAREGGATKLFPKQYGNDMTANRRAARRARAGGVAPLPMTVKSDSKTEKSLNHGDTMSNTYEDLFKSELNPNGDSVLIDCPHCDAPITKSEVLEKGKRRSKAAKESIAAANKDNFRGPRSGHTTTNVRGGHGIPQHGGGLPDPSKAHKALTRDRAFHEGRAVFHEAAAGHRVNKSDADSDSGEGDDPMDKSLHPVVRGSAFIQYVDDGGDEAIAKAIAEGSLGQGGLVSQPLDKNNSPTRV